jgi:hypothetical protein
MLIAFRPAAADWRYVVAAVLIRLVLDPEMALHFRAAYRGKFEITVNAGQRRFRI